MASINLQGDTSGSISISAPSVAGSNTLTLPATTQTLATQNALGVRNLIINGDMRIDQRNAGSAITAGGFMVDRWQNFQSQSSKWTSIQQVTDAPTGATHSVKYTSASAYTVGAADYFTHEQKIEGNIAAHLGWGASGAKTVTLSFYVKSSLTGTFGGAFYAGSGSYGYPFEYTIDAANTWEKKTITIEGPTSGTFNTDNSASFTVCFGLGIGTDYSWTAGSWQAQVVRSATGATSVVGTSGATWQVSLAQLEVGDTATPFEHRPWDDELIRCMRYYEKCINYSTVEPAGGYTGVEWTDIPRDKPANYAIKDVKYKVRKRASATVNFWSLNQTVNQFGNVYTGVDLGNAGAIWGSEQGFTWRNETGGTISASSNNGLAVLWAASSELQLWQNINQ